MIWDFNWKSACDKSLCAQWSVASNIKSVKSGTVAPIRCVNEGASAEFAASHDILGIPHHLAMVYAVTEFEWQPATAFRLRRCGKVVWAIKPNLYENARLRASAGEAARRVGYTTSLLEAWSTWHARAGDVCNAAANFGLAEQICKPERAKGTAPSTRAVAEKRATGRASNVCDGPASSKSTSWERDQRSLLPKSRIGEHLCKIKSLNLVDEHLLAKEPRWPLSTKLFPSWTSATPPASSLTGK